MISNEKISTNSSSETLNKLERERDGVDLYHVTGWDEILDLDVGDAFTLVPGSQNSQGVGVYFSEEIPRFTAAEGAKGNPKGIINIKGGLQTEGWYRSKSAFSKKFGYPRTRHTNGQDINLRVVKKETLEIDGNIIPILKCDYDLMPSKSLK